MKNNLKALVLPIALISLASCSNLSPNSAVSSIASSSAYSSTISSAVSSTVSSSNQSSLASSSAVPSSTTVSSSKVVSSSQPVSSSKPTISSQAVSSSPVISSAVSSLPITSSGDVGEILNIVSSSYSNEKIALKFDKNIKGKYKFNILNNGNITPVDDNLIFDDYIYVVGIKSGVYALQMVSKTDETKSLTFSNINVTKIDRSGYAHFNNESGVGAYDNNGVLKNNANVIYVNDDNKNTVELKDGSKTYTGLGNILKNASNLSRPLDIRILGSIKTNQFKPKELPSKQKPFDNPDFCVNELETTYTNLDGLNSWANVPSSASEGSGYTKRIVGDSGSTDSYFNMMDIKNASNLTIEGIGDDAEFFQWGMNFKTCNSIEVRNITFTDYPEDACSLEGSSNDKLDDYSGFFFHHNTFNQGKNNWDLSEEQDKHEGDGSTDFKYASKITVAYSRYNNTHKSNLIGGGDTQRDKDITLHHNFYNSCESRLPLARQANIHAYNNYYYKSSNTCQDVRANCLLFSEYNYFESCKTAQTYKDNSTNIKSFNDVLISCKSVKSTKVTSRTATVTNKCSPDGKTDYSSFDTDVNLFYYDSSNNRSDVELLESAENAKKTASSQAGVFYF